MRRTTLLAASCSLAVAFWAPAAFAATCAGDPASATTIICNDPALHAADDAVAAALAQTQALLTADEAKTMGGNELVWFDQREMNCSGDMDGMALSEADHKACLAGEIEGRRLYLLGMPAEGPGMNSRIVPFVRQGADMSYIWALRFAAPETPGETLFNSIVDGDLANIHLAADDNDFTDNFAMHLDYASSSLISANVMGTYLGEQYAHPMSFQHQINIDLETGKRLTFDDAFAPEGLASLQRSCMDQLEGSLTPDGEFGDLHPIDVRVAVADLDQWSFGADAAKIVFDPEDEDPNWTCRFAYSDIEPLVKARFPLPGR